MDLPRCSPSSSCYLLGCYCLLFPSPSIPKQTCVPSGSPIFGNISSPAGSLFSHGGNNLSPIHTCVSGAGGAGIRPGTSLEKAGKLYSPTSRLLLEFGKNRSSTKRCNLSKSGCLAVFLGPHARQWRNMNLQERRTLHYKKVCLEKHKRRFLSRTQNAIVAHIRFPRYVLPLCRRSINVLHRFVSNRFVLVSQRGMCRDLFLQLVRQNSDQ